MKTSISVEKAIDMLDNLRKSEDSFIIADIFFTLQEAYDENKELFEPLNVYADYLSANIGKSKTQAELALTKLCVFIANNSFSVKECVNDYGSMTPDVLKYLEDSPAGKAISQSIKEIDNERIEFLNQHTILENGKKLLNLEDTDSTSTTKSIAVNRRIK